jgi:hypothetical protein
LCLRRGGVGTEVGRSIEAALRRAMEGSQKDTTDDECSEAVSVEAEPMTGVWKGFVIVFETVGDGGDVRG